MTTTRWRCLQVNFLPRSSLKHPGCWSERATCPAVMSSFKFIPIAYQYAYITAGPPAVLLFLSSLQLSVTPACHMLMDCLWSCESVWWEETRMFCILLWVSCCGCISNISQDPHIWHESTLSEKKSLQIWRTKVPSEGAQSSSRDRILHVCGPKLAVKGFEIIWLFRLPHDSLLCCDHNY